jgi:hypothetical protein
MGTTPDKASAAAVSTCTCKANWYDATCSTECKDSENKKVNSGKTACECKDTYWFAMSKELTCTKDCTTGLTGYALDGTKCKCAADYAVKDGKCVKCSVADANSKPKDDGSACECKTDYLHNGTSCV